MNHYNFAEQLGELYEKAGQTYARGQRGADGCPVHQIDAPELAFLAANGLTAQNLYDYAEDDAGGNGPGWAKALAIESVRRDYFLNIQHGQAAAQPPLQLLLLAASLSNCAQAAEYDSL